MTDSRERLRRFALVASRWTGIAQMAEPHLRGLGSILMLHSVTAKPRASLGLNDHLSVTPNFLDLAIRHMKQAGYSFVSLDEMIANLRMTSRTKLATITLDDGYLDNLTEALPVFEHHATPFAIFIAPALIDGTIQPWWEVAEAVALEREIIELPKPFDGKPLISATRAQKLTAARQLSTMMATQMAETDRQAWLDAMGARELYTSAFMSWQNIRQIAEHSLGKIGAHTLHHYNLARLSAELALEEINGSADLLARQLGKRPAHFAYPYGHAQAVGAREAQLVAQCGFASALTTRHGTIHPEHADHMHALPRLSLNGRFQDVAHLQTMLTGFTTLANSRRRVVTL